MRLDRPKARLQQPLIQHIHVEKRRRRRAARRHKRRRVRRPADPRGKRRHHRRRLGAAGVEAVVGGSRREVKVAAVAEALRGHGQGRGGAAERGLAVVFEIRVVEVRGAGARGAVARRGGGAGGGVVGVVAVLLLLLELAGQLGEAGLVLGEDGVHGQVEVAVGADAAELGGDVVDDGLAAVVELWLAELPGLAAADHGVELVDGGDEGELRVFEDFGVSVVV